ncbi:unnamed protein product [Phytophthora fragariaefolia]|uniref:Unnamed protein product n=1 Tax=Phytophthora fragariaefolia TaxID=1490495 RepID=A0A9W6X634_9STRA|nr:unnamed protein product [Phytophthora fragariaefolia]
MAKSVSVSTVLGLIVMVEERVKPASRPRASPLSHAGTSSRTAFRVGLVGAALVGEGIRTVEAAAGRREHDLLLEPRRHAGCFVLNGKLTYDDDGHQNVWTTQFEAGWLQVEVDSGGTATASPSHQSSSFIMGKSSSSNITAEQEFSKLEQLLIQTAGEIARCLKTLKTGLAEYDRRHGLLFINTSKSFMRKNIRAAKDTASELRYVADQISKSEPPSESEITATRSKINEVSDALDNLKRTARAYDRKGKSDGIVGIAAKALTGTKSDSNDGSNKATTTSEDSWLGDNSGSNSERSSTDGISSTIDTVEVVVRLTLRNNFNGASALKHQVSIAEESLVPSFADHVMDAVNAMSNSLKGQTNFAPEGKEKKSLSI